MSEKFLKWVRKQQKIREKVAKFKAEKEKKEKEALILQKKQFIQNLSPIKTAFHIDPIDKKNRPQLTDSPIIPINQKTPSPKKMLQRKSVIEINYENLDTLISASTGAAEKLILDGTKHFDYSDTPQFSKASRKFGISGSMDLDELRNVLNTRIVSFFELNLKQ